MSYIGLGKSNKDKNSLDFSSFPLLRIDQLSNHETETLIESKIEISNLLAPSTNEAQSNGNVKVDTITKYAYKLHEHIVDEIGNREAYERVTMILSGKMETSSHFSSSNGNINPYSNDNNSQTLNTVLDVQKKLCEHTNFMNKNNSIYTSKKVRHRLKKKNELRNENSLCCDTLGTKKNASRTNFLTPIPNTIKGISSHPNIFISGNQSQNAGFKYRVKAARLRLKARSFDSIEMQKKAKMQVKRDQRIEAIKKRLKAKQKEKEEKSRKMIELEEKRKQRKQMQEAKKKMVVQDMKMAAEYAKQKACDAGKSVHEAALEAAAAAAEIIEVEAEIDSYSEESLSENSFDCKSSDSNFILSSSSENVLFNLSKDERYRSNITIDDHSPLTYQTEMNGISFHESFLPKNNDSAKTYNMTEDRGNVDKNQSRIQDVQKKTLEQSKDPPCSCRLTSKKIVHGENFDSDNDVNKESSRNSNKEHNELFSTSHETSLYTNVAFGFEEQENNQQETSETSNVLLHNISNRLLQSMQTENQDLTPKTKAVNIADITVETELEKGIFLKTNFEKQPTSSNGYSHCEDNTSTNVSSKFLHAESQLDSEPKSKTSRNNMKDFICDETSIQVASTKKKMKNQRSKENTSNFISQKCNSNAINKKIPLKSFEFADHYSEFHKIFTAFHVGGYDENTKITQKYKKMLDYKDVYDWLRSQWKLMSTFERVMFDLDLCELPTVESNQDKSENDQKRVLNSCRGLYYRIGSIKSEVFGIISDSLSKSNSLMKWRELPTDNGLGNSWNLLWTWSKPKINFRTLLIFQKVNHFQNSKYLTRKDLLKKKISNLCSATSTNCQGVIQRSFNDHVGRNSDLFHIMPQTYILPQEYNAFVSAFVKKQNNMAKKATNFWILKPTGLSRGRGISLINDIGNVSYADSIIMQEYILKPLLIDGYKFDLRIYVLVSSFNPLEAFIYREGFARFGSSIFSTLPEDKDDERIHLTNSSIQQKYWNDFKPDHPVKNAGSHGDGNKVSLTWLWMFLEKRKYSTKVMWKSICDVCIKTLLCVEDEISYQPNAFEVYGFDIMFDEAARPWLIEVNSSPSLSRETKLDVKVKEALISDTINLLDPPSIDRKALQEICLRRAHKNPTVGWRTYNGTSEKAILDADLRRILMNKLPRQYGQLPRKGHLGNFVRLAPGTSSFESITKMKRYVLGIKSQNAQL